MTRALAGAISVLALSWSVRAQSITVVPPPPGPFAIGPQLALDGTFTEPALSPQAGLVLEGWLDPRWSVRLVPSFGYIPVVGGPTVTDPRTGVAEHRLMSEVRLAVGYAIEPGIVARLFADGRMVDQIRPNPSPSCVVVDTTPNPICVEPGLPNRLHDWFTVSGGTEWTWRPEESHRLELTASVGAGAAIRQTFNAGVPHLDVSGLVHASIAIGWVVGL